MDLGKLVADQRRRVRGRQRARGIAGEYRLEQVGARAGGHVERRSPRCERMGEHEAAKMLGVGALANRQPSPRADSDQRIARPVAAVAGPGEAAEDRPQAERQMRDPDGVTVAVDALEIRAGIVTAAPARQKRFVLAAPGQFGVEVDGVGDAAEARQHARAVAAAGQRDVLAVPTQIRQRHVAQLPGIEVVARQQRGHHGQPRLLPRLQTPAAPPGPRIEGGADDAKGRRRRPDHRGPPVVRAINLRSRTESSRARRRPGSGDRFLSGRRRGDESPFLSSRRRNWRPPSFFQ